MNARVAGVRVPRPLDGLVKMPYREPANDDGKCRCMCLDCRVDLHVLCDNGTCADDPWPRYFR